MNTEVLLEGFREILVLEERVKCFYDHYIEQVADSNIKSQLSSIRDDEIRHIEIVRKLIEWVS